MNASISDIHFGAFVTRTDLLYSFLTTFCPRLNRLYLNGDTTDCGAVAPGQGDRLDFPESEMACLLQLAKLHAGGCEIIRLPGNHDPLLEVWTPLLNVTVAPVTGVAVESAGRKFLIQHGHAFDLALLAHPWISAAAISASRLLGWANAWAARAVKSWEQHLRPMDGPVADGMSRLASTKACTGGCTAGHTHNAMDLMVTTGTGPIHYINSGAWCTNDPPSYVAISDGEMRLSFWRGPTSIPAAPTEGAPDGPIKLSTAIARDPGCTAGGRSSAGNGNGNGRSPNAPPRPPPAPA